MRIKIKTKRLILRPFHISDYKQWLWLETHRLPPKGKFDKPLQNKSNLNFKYFKWLVNVLKDDMKQDEYYRIPAFELKSNKLVGYVSFSIISRGSYQMANFGYHTYSLYRKLGFGTEMARAGLKIGFQSLKLNRLEAAIDRGNVPSIRLARAIGMRKEGTKENYVYNGQVWEDSLIYVANPSDVGLKPTTPQIF